MHMKHYCIVLGHPNKNLTLGVEVSNPGTPVFTFLNHLKTKLVGQICPKS